MTFDSIKEIRKVEDEIEKLNETAEKEISKNKENIPLEIDTLTSQIQSDTIKKVGKLEEKAFERINQGKEEYLNKSSCDCADLKKKVVKKQDKAIDVVVDYIYSKVKF